MAYIYNNSLCFVIVFLCLESPPEIWYNNDVNFNILVDFLTNEWITYQKCCVKIKSKLKVRYQVIFTL